jgi:hypothetical protein
MTCRRSRRGGEDTPPRGAPCQYLAGGAGSPRLLPAGEAEMCPPARCYKSLRRLGRTREWSWRQLVRQHTIQGAHHYHLNLRAASVSHVLHPTDKSDAPSGRKDTKPENIRVQPPQGVPASTHEYRDSPLVCVRAWFQKKIPPQLLPLSVLPTGRTTQAGTSRPGLVGRQAWY